MEPEVIPTEETKQLVRAEEAELDKQRELVQNILLASLNPKDPDVNVAINLLYAMRKATEPPAGKDGNAFAQAVCWVMQNMEMVLFNAFLDE